VIVNNNLNMSRIIEKDNEIS